MQIDLRLGDSKQILKTISENSIDSIVTDPPYEYGFMNKKWDKTGIAYDVELWQECLRVLKPGGYLLAFGSSRTHHRLMVAIEDAGFEIRDTICWAFGSGFPKSLNIGKAIDKLQGNERENLGQYDPRSTIDGAKRKDRKIGGQQVAPSNTSKLIKTKGESEFEGWGTALKPAVEYIAMARKPLSEKSVALNCLKWKTGGINIDESRVETNDTYQAKGMTNLGVMHDDNWKPKEIVQEMNANGRFPANLIHDGSEEVSQCFPTSSKGWVVATNSKKSSENSMFNLGGVNENRYDMGVENASRFFKSIIYQAKASQKERNEGCESLEIKAKKFGNQKNGKDIGNGSVNDKFTTQPSKNNHATVKPVKLMEYLIKMVTPKGGIVLDPFLGSGTTGIAAKKNNYSFIGIEIIKEHFEICKARINNAKADLKLFE
jgi:DNA modification methylase